ncbi:hypothetical protein CPB85DRAFT_112786 [Mucidula mucida]|nr:hypothetical protein CPB85DRAFT_112786 [Mucidula mucida]
MSTQAIPTNIAELTGPLVLGHFFNWGLFGALTVQSYIYYLAFPRDRWLAKSIVASVYSLELIQTVLATRDAFRNFGTGWGDMTDLNEVGFLWFSVPVMGSIIGFVAQLFFAWRIWILSSRLYIPVIICLLSATQCIAGVWSGIYSHIIGVFSDIPEHTFVSTSLWLGGTALCDVIVAFSMMYYLNRSRTGFRSTNVILSRFIRITIETGAICATFAVLDLAFFLSYRHNNFHLAPSIALSKLYSNSLLVVLNARVRFVGGRDSGAWSEDFSLAAIVTTTDFQFPGGASSSFGHRHGHHSQTSLPDNTLNIAVARGVTGEYEDDDHKPPRDADPEYNQRKGVLVE